MFVPPQNDVLASHLFISLVAAMRNHDYFVVGSDQFELYTSSTAKNLVFQ